MPRCVWFPQLLVGLLAGLAAGCTPSEAQTPLGSPPEAAKRLDLADDVLALARIWHGALGRCRVAPPVPGITLQASRVDAWDCTVAGWSRVTLLRLKTDATVRALHADTDSTSYFQACDSQRFATRRTVLDSMEAQIISQATLFLHDGPFEGSTFSSTAYYDDPGKVCSIGIGIGNLNAKAKAGATTER